MDHQVQNCLQTLFLSSDDIGQIFALYTLAQSATPHGFLATRSKDYFREIIRKPDEVIAIGIRDKERLIAYSICHRVTTNPYSEYSLLSTIKPATCTVYHGDGTVVDPEYLGRRLAMRLFQVRLEEMIARRIDHMISLVAVDNLASIGNSLLAGAILVGFARDETAMNYILYVGTLSDRLNLHATPIEVVGTDQKKLKRLFAEGYAVCGLGRPTSGPGSPRDSGARLFRLLPVK